MEVFALDLRTLLPREEEALARLSPERREKALRLREGDARLRSVGAGLLLRRIVGHGPFSLGTAGKPFLPEGPCFSLTHSGMLSALAVDDLPVGLDAEWPRPVSEALLRRVLTEEELDWIGPDPDRRFAFLWTRKEAALKRTGEGITRPLREIRALPGAENGFALFTMDFNGCIISAAREGDASFVLREVTAAELLEGE